ncbi:TonB-dependent receptor domain-containing protein [Neolewinella persica]|uniref:TonB-dependent receptor domain-containing protein n=1 Tax=Neolewinella persica TaxID=70998 RepID=UPI00035EA159|nr:TonB-dependent receptor [Neolewinella persica]
MHTIYAQEAEVIGKVTDAEGEPLIGATVQVIGSVIGTSTDLDGHYFLQVPPGRIRLLYTYIGYENFDTLLTVGVAEREIEIDVIMPEAFLETGEVIVFGRRASGQAQALRNQQSSHVNQTIIHSEVFNKYPDVTIAETVSRMPGVSIIRDVGEGEIVQVRGLPEQYTAVTLNGQRLPTIQPEVDQSGSLSIIQSSLVDEVRVIKARSADMDGDAIAGTVNFRVRHPEEKFEILLQAGQGTNFGFDDNPNQSSGITQFSGILNSELSEEKVYALLAGSYLSQGRGNRTQLFEYGAPNERGTNLYSSRPFDTDRQSERVGLVGAIELRPSIYNRMRLSYNFSQLSEDVQQRQLFAHGGDSPSVNRISSGWNTTKSLNLVALEVENNFPRTRLDYQLSFSQNTEELNDRLRSSYTGLTTGFSENELRDLTPYSVASSTPLAGVLNFQDEALLDETVAIGSLNITRYLNRNRNSFIKFGGRYRSKDRLYGSNNLILPTSGAETIPAGTFGAVPTDRFREETDSLQTEAKAYDAKQRIAAGYLMYAANFNSKLSLSAGLRYEYLEVEARDAADTVSFDDIDLLPSINLTYRLRRDRQFRFSYYGAVGRPSYATYRPELSQPLALIGVDQFSRSNSDIAATRSQNFDLAFERYGRRDGLLTVGLYGKFLNDPTVRVSESDFDSRGRPTYTTRLINANRANVFGFEVGFYQNLGFLQSTLRHVNVNGTYNFNTFSVDNPGGVDDGLPLAQAPRQSANLSLVYSNPNTKFNLVIAANYRDRVFDRLLDDEAIYQNTLFSADVSADYEVFKNISIYLRANNLMDHPFEEWIGKPGEDGSLLRSTSNYGRWGVVGIRYRPG